MIDRYRSIEEFGIGMAAMVAQGSSPLSSSIFIQEKGSRNKRKFRADTPPMDLNTLAPPLQTECCGYEFLPEGKALDYPNLECPAAACNLCTTPSYGPREDEIEFEESPDAHWGDLTETQLEEILLSNLDIIFKSAIKQITSYGYTEEITTNAVLRSGICCGRKVTVSDIVENALAFLRSGQEVDSSLQENFSKDLQKLEESVLADMITVLREVRPFFSTGDAMWCLLICDMNVTHACAMDCDLLNVMGNDDTTTSSTVPQLESQSGSVVSSSSTIPEFNAPGFNKLNTTLSCPQSTPQSRIPMAVGIPNLPSGRFCASSNSHGTISNLNILKEDPISSSECPVEPSCSTISRSCLPEEKQAGGRKGHVGISKRESILRQKTIQFEKSHRAFRSKAALRTCKLSSLGGLVLDKKCKSGTISASMTVKSASLKLSKAVWMETSQASSLNIGPSSSSSCSMETAGSPSTFPVASTELSLSLPSTSIGVVSTKSHCSFGTTTCSNHLSIPSDKICGHWVPQDKKDKMQLMLAPRVSELQGQLQGWTEWAHEKVMQAARRLSKDKVELQNLRKEKEEANRLKKEKQTLEENTRKKLSEMEIALSKASGQVEKANVAANRLEVENAELRQEMEAAKLQAVESAASCQEVSSREIITLKKFQSWDRQKALFQEELTTEKRKLSQLQQQVKQAKEFQDQLQAKWKLEESMKDEALMQASSLRKEREQIETSGKAKENAIRLNAETDLRRYKDDIRRLEDQIAQLRLSDSSKITPLRWGVDGTNASRISEGRKGSTAHFIAKIMNSLELEAEDVQRERECVMCLTEEMSVVFLPCAHQVVCTKCNDLHEKQGMKDCPSCRTPIQRRIRTLSSEC